MSDIKSYEKLFALQDISGTKEKKKFIRDNADDNDFKNLLYYALNPLLTYNISSQRLLEAVDKYEKQEHKDGTASPRPFNTIIECLDYLSCLRGMDDATVRHVAMLLVDCYEKDARDLYIKIISKTLRLGVTAKTVDEIIPGLIPEWEVQQSYPIDKYPIEDGTEFWLTQKLNGVRATFLDGKLIARSGNPYTGVEHITDVLEREFGEGFVFDGELTLRDKGNLSDNEAFRVATGILNSDMPRKITVSYTIFDVIPRDDFVNCKQSMNYAARRELIDRLSADLSVKVYEDWNPNWYVKFLPVLYHGNDISVIDGFLEQMVREDKEGLILNTNVPYKRTRHRGILKIKRFYTMDLPIIRCEEGTGRLERTLGAFVLDYKGNEVKVGTGFSDEQRAQFWEDQDELIERRTLCEVKYKEISKDKTTGKESLQFPVFLSLRTDKSEVSYA